MHDVAIIGGGPAGVAAAIYAARYRLKTLLVSPDIGGWAKKAHMIENDPGFVSILGKDLADKLLEHVKANDIEYAKAKVTGLLKAGDSFAISTAEKTYDAKYVIYASGTIKRKLGVPGEDAFLGRGVCLCATCDAPFFKAKNVAVIGGNDSGATSALLIAQYAEKVTIVEIADKLPCEPIWLDKIRADPKIDVITGDSVKEILGEKVVSGVMLNSGKRLDASGVFIEIGQIPDSSMARELGAGLDKWGHIMVGKDQMSSVDGLYAAGDLTDGSNYMRQIVAAQAEGAIAAQAIYKRVARQR